MIIRPCIKVDQPIGRFYLTSLPASTLKQITKVDSRDLVSETGIQRSQKPNRIKEISEYCSDPDATFPTSIVVSVLPEMMQYCSLVGEETAITIDETKVIGQIIDGQHRLEGISQSEYIDRFELPVVFMFNMTQKENAYVFSIINSKQKSVNPSHIVDLLSFTDERSPQKTAHEIAKSLNSMEDSPFYSRLKMLGYNVQGQENATLSQGTFAAQLITLISKNPDDDARRVKRKEKLTPDPTLPLRDYFIDNHDEVILKLMMNCFKAVETVFTDESAKAKSNILWKTTGFSAIIKSFPEMYRAGEKRHDLSQSYFTEVFSKVKTYLEEKQVSLTGEKFGGGGRQVQQTLAQYIVEAVMSM